MSAPAVVSGQIPALVADYTMDVGQSNITQGNSGQTNFTTAPVTAVDPVAAVGTVLWNKVRIINVDSIGGAPHALVAGTADGLTGGIVFPKGCSPALLAATGQAPTWMSYRVQTWLSFASDPTLAGMCGVDTGLAFYAAAIIDSGRIFTTNGATAPANAPGFIFQVSAPDKAFRFIANNLNWGGVTNGANTINRLLRAPAAGWLKPFLLEVRLISSINGADGSMQAFLDGLPLTSESWGAGLLPKYVLPAGGRFQSFIPMVVSGSIVTVNPNLFISGARQRIGTVAAILLD
jgi:hypothetical protein